MSLAVLANEARILGIADRTIQLNGDTMLTPPQVAEAYFLESRHMLLEIAAYLDRYDAAVARGNHSNGNGNAKASNAATAEKKLDVIRRALAITSEAQPTKQRTLTLLELFAAPETKAPNP